ncbi:beta-1,4-glucuronyltransferase 1 [Lepeophtheirus salmonis]|uniref:beta-1,4-glucuronyltransferase 1 n=1 Tax=Lepeophtheirus salmonis TaxID=72036 RepID=UPI001AE1C8B2|nr:beta-1,4-glucuronyltransferase 1-like [Lepeophtheirus salmonis]XP_040583045.1 beta-1,4-glucuronyltransferase 1-like [Lepeophtheirus salmonis]XP_040583046.1 beta-1,4-glucuronyltransferase 1-like [Lepeophtheirus salmonis]XP_040583047.1 beta-1,4-glucuronyltransferase 1-like [Lepeophtheirus salmonis]XP_040583048.1 beta-1,4-glucuronyltransferase 1-like [Lepeophtheirus salmonis]
MYLSTIRSRSIVNWTGLLLIFILIVLFYTVWLNRNSTTIDRDHFVPEISRAQVKEDSIKVLEKGIAFDNVHRFNPSFSCQDKYPFTRREQRGKYWVLYNYVRPSNKNYTCDESITYTTHGDFTFNDNLVPLLKRWNGPVSMALYAPGWDFYSSLKSIYYYQNCVNSSLVKDFLTFHLFFDNNHLPSFRNEEGSNEVQPPPPIQDFESETTNYNCKSILKDILQSNQTLYKQKNKLDYPVNVGRNIARQEATTHFIFPSDVELYPSPDLIPAFLSMIRENTDPALSRPNPRVFVNSIFEVQKNIKKMPGTKVELLNALETGDAIPFHQKVCPLCHNIPNSKEWKNESVIEDKMKIFHTAKRVSPFQHWEPIYIGTNEEPLYDERLSWEGRSDKMTQGYQLCLKNYDFHILNNAFLIHRPGIKSQNKPSKKQLNQVSRQNHFIRNNISKEIDLLYGQREGCRLY